MLTLETPYGFHSSLEMQSLRKTLGPGKRCDESLKRLSDMFRVHTAVGRLRERGVYRPGWHRVRGCRSRLVCIIHFHSHFLLIISVILCQHVGQSRCQ